VSVALVEKRKAIIVLVQKEKEMIEKINKEEEEDADDDDDEDEQKLVAEKITKRAKDQIEKSKVLVTKYQDLKEVSGKKIQVCKEKASTFRNRITELQMDLQENTDQVLEL
jgi:hypothetical protein